MRLYLYLIGILLFTMTSNHLVEGLEESKSQNSYRCMHCNQMQPAGSSIIFVPDSVKVYDPAWSITEECNKNKWNGHFSGWCLKCARKLGK